MVSVTPFEEEKLDYSFKTEHETRRLTRTNKSHDHRDKMVTLTTLNQ